MSELKLCPFCGSEINPNPTGTKYPAKWNEYEIECEACGAHVHAKLRKDVVFRWNCRPIEDALRAENARLRDDLAALLKYVTVLENEPVRSKSVIKRLRTQCGLPMEEK